MKRQTFRKIARVSGIVSLLLVVVLCIHIYDVTHRASPGQQRVMARIDLKQDINEADAATIAAWLYQQKGVDHVLCNPATDIAVFTFSPALNTADNIVSSFTASLPYKAERYLPAKQDMMKGCPITANSFSDKIISIYRSISIFPKLKQ